jgi:Putative lumazine-binding
MANYLQDLDDVRALIQLYVDGSNGDVAKLKKAFHPDARMYGHIGPMDTYIPITGFFAWSRRSPAWLARSTRPSCAPST